MSSRSDVALEKFSNGYNCAQSVLYSFCDELGMDRNAALKTACGFGAGMGRKQGVCGAVSGGVLVIGSKYGRGERDTREATEKTYGMIRELLDRFIEKHGSSLCRELLGGCDLSTEEGRKFFKENDLFCKTCKPCVETVVGIVERIL